MRGVHAGIFVDKKFDSGIIKQKGGIMKKIISVTLALLIISLMLSGCCPFSKKKLPTKEQPVSNQSVSQPQTQSEPGHRTTEPASAKLPDTGKATPEEVGVATKGGEIPPVKTEEPTFVSPSEDIKSIFQPIYFDFDKYNIKTSEYGKLKAIAEYLKNNPAVSILIEGHCDERGTDEYNLVLGEKRALSTRNFLVALGISPKRLYTISYGESRPADPGHNEEAWAKNRRAEFKIKQ